MKHIFKVFNYSIYNYKDAEALLNGMAEKGYEYKGCGTGWIKGFAMFEQNERAKNICYGIDIKGELTDEERVAYYEFYRQMGWKKTGCYRKKLHIFERNRESATPLYSDNQTEYENFKEEVRLNGQVCKAAIVVALLAMMIRFFLKMEISFVSLFCAILFSIYSVHIVLVNISNIYYCMKCKKYIDEGAPIPENTGLKKLSFIENLFTMALFFIAPLAAACLYFNLRWGSAAAMYAKFGEAWTAQLLFWMTIGSVPLLLAATYFLFQKPESRFLKILDFIIACAYLFGIYSAISLYGIIG